MHFALNFESKTTNKQTNLGYILFQWIREKYKLSFHVILILNFRSRSDALEQNKS